MLDNEPQSFIPQKRKISNAYQTYDCLPKTQLVVDSFLLQIFYHMHKLKLILTDYIYYQNEKSKSRLKDWPLWKNDSTIFLDRW